MIQTQKRTERTEVNVSLMMTFLLSRGLFFCLPGDLFHQSISQGALLGISQGQNPILASFCLVCPSICLSSSASLGWSYFLPRKWMKVDNFF